MSWEIAAVIVSALALVLNLVLIAFVMPLRRRLDRIEQLKSDVKQTAERLIESKLAGLVTHLEGVVNVVNERVSNIRERLAAGDANFADLDKRDRELEARFNARFDQFKDYLHAHFATRDDLQKLKDSLPCPPRGMTGGKCDA